MGSDDEKLPLLAPLEAMQPSEWIAIAVPSIIDESTCALDAVERAQDRLLSLSGFRCVASARRAAPRIPDLRRREHAIRAELQSIADQTTDRTAYLRLVETLTAFLTRLHRRPKLSISSSVSASYDCS
jgi:hypothetical protein